MKTRILIADDHAIVRDGVKALLAAAGEFEVVAEASNGRQAIDMAVSLEPEVVLMDIAMPGLGGIEATLEIRKAVPTTKVIVLSQYGDPEYVRRLMRAGVSGYVLKNAAGAELVAAIRAVRRGGLVLDPQIAREAVQEPGTPGEHGVPDAYETLTDREKQVLKLVAEGHSNKEVAGQLNISVKTAMSHREHVMTKLHVHNRTELIRFALRAGVIRAEA
jgi:DNA-binding NarL/FixJ family response regulator